MAWASSFQRVPSSGTVCKRTVPACVPESYKIRYCNLGPLTTEVMSMPTARPTILGTKSPKESSHVHMGGDMGHRSPSVASPKSQGFSMVRHSILPRLSSSQPYAPGSRYARCPSLPFIPRFQGGVGFCSSRQPPPTSLPPSGRHADALAPKQTENKTVGCAVCTS